MSDTLPIDNSLAAVYELFRNKKVVAKVEGGRRFGARLVRIGKTHLIFQNQMGLSWAYKPDQLEMIALQKNQDVE
jgi:hypothetical protein